MTLGAMHTSKRTFSKGNTGGSRVCISMIILPNTFTFFMHKIIVCINILIELTIYIYCLIRFKINKMLRQKTPILSSVKTRIEEYSLPPLFKLKIKM